jgi:hypothetical protein
MASTQRAIGHIKPDWGHILTENGLLYKLEIHWYKGQVKIDPADLDLEHAVDEKFNELFQLGRKSLIPKIVFNEFHRIETRGRTELEKYFDTPFGSFVPYTIDEAFNAKMAAVERAFWEAFDSLYQHYNTYRRNTLANYEAIADKVFVNGSKAKMTERLLAHVESLMPHRDNLRHRFSFVLTPYHITTPKEILALEKAAEGEAIKFKVNRKLAETYQAKSSQEINKFLADSSKKLYGMVDELAKQALASIKKNDGVLVPRLSTTLKNMVVNFQNMNFLKSFGMGQDIENRLVELRKFIADTDGAGMEDRGLQVKEKLSELTKALKASIRNDAGNFIREIRRDMEL